MKGSAGAAMPNFSGEILLCEDNDINQHFIKSHLNRVGLSVVIAGDGREGVDIVQGRVKSGEKPFDLIFMDIQMPVMDGLEASELITGMGVKTPMVALTANVTPEDQEVYARHGISRSLCKPFTPEQLWECLGAYFTPVAQQKISDEARQADDERQRVKLFSSFVRRNQTTYADICGALKAGDVKLAHRLAHTLRGLAGLMGKKELQEASRLVENALAGGDASALAADTLSTLGKELATVLTELVPYLDGDKTAAVSEDWDKDAAKALFDKLEPLLQGDNAEAQRFAEPLKTIPGTGELVTLLEDYEFESALEALDKVRKTLNI